MNRREELASNLHAVQARILEPSVTLIVVTKRYPVSDLQILSELGVRDFGENRNEEGVEKSASLAATWHFQGEIQGRKLRDIAQWADVIHSLDSASHITKLDSVAQKRIDVFLQLSLDGDPARGGVVASALPPLAEKILATSHLHLMGLMCIPPVHAEPRQAFAEIALIHNRFVKAFPTATKLSAGMSADFEIAIDHGATHIRVGSSILGSRSAR